MFKVHQEMYMYQLHNKMFPLHVRMPILTTKCFCFVREIFYLNKTVLA
jgi:hypothetical protein